MSKVRIIPSLSLDTLVGAHTLISSRPSCPCTTNARLAPRSWRALANISVSCGAYTPINWQLAPAGFVKGPEHVENRAHRQLFSRLRGMFHGSVEARRKKKTYSDFPYRLLDDFRTHFEIHPQGFQQIRAAAFARNRPVAVLGYRNTAPGNNECRRGRDIERIRESPPVPQVSTTTSMFV